LPDGEPYATRVRVTRPHALVMLKLLALFDRYHNIRGPEEARHDREEAQTHAADIVAIVKARPDWAEFRRQFEAQFAADAELGKRVSQILNDFFREPLRRDIFFTRSIWRRLCRQAPRPRWRFETKARLRIVLCRESCLSQGCKRNENDCQFDSMMKRNRHLAIGREEMSEQSSFFGWPKLGGSIPFISQCDRFVPWCVSFRLDSADIQPIPF